MRFSIRDTYVLLLSVVCINTAVWMDSLDRYLSTRYHFSLSDYAPALVLETSRAIGEWSQAVSLVQEAPNVAEEAPPAQAGAAVVAAAPTAPATASTAGNESKSSPAPEIVPLAGKPHILFIGDSMMQGVAPFVISHARKLYPEGVFVDRSKQSTGLTVRRYFDWPQKIREEFERQKFDTVVVFLGPNDPWDINEDGKRYVFPTEPWVEKYRTRVAEVLDFAKENKVRVIWLGLPNMRNERVRQGALVENKVFQEETSRYGFEFLPTEDFIGRLDAPFQKYAEDEVKGKYAVRADDGIHFTPAGLRLISSRVINVLSTQRQG